MIRTSSTPLRTITLLTLLVVAFASETPAQVRVTIGAKAWLSSWNITFPQQSGVTITDFSEAILVGPFLSIRSGSWTTTLFYSTTGKPYDGKETSPGFHFISYDANRSLSRQDINAFVAYNLSPEINIFANLKYLSYRIKTAATSIYETQITVDQEAAGLGFGLGAQITVPFSGGSPLYSFISSGALFNTSKTEAAAIKVNGIAIPPTEGFQGGDSAAELFYFLDAGIGLRIPPTNLGMSFGIRVENGPETKTTIGPTANIFYSF